MSETLSLAVVGHTNTGKTSLMRTLLRDDAFGEVRNAAATTRHVEEAVITDGGTPLIRLYDTPGLEDAGGILDWLESETSPQRDGIERLRIFLQSPAAQNEFSQEAKVLRQLIHSDMALYVIDAREPVLPKYKDELTILSWCAKPVMPVFNFTHGQDLSAWQEMLARRNLHVSGSFDTVAFDFEGEMRLWENLATMLPQRGIPERLIAARRREWAELDKQSRLDIAHFLLDTAAYAQGLTDATQLPQLQQHMHQSVRDLERQLHEQMLKRYRFYRSEITRSEWQLNVLEQNPFDSSQLKHYGIRTTRGAATGALIGLGIDTLTMGLSLGLGTALGGVIGGLFPNFNDLSDKIKGVQTVRIDSPTLAVLAARALDLLEILQTRGHAAQHNIAAAAARTPWQPDRPPEVLKTAQHHDKWSSLNGTPAAQAHTARQDAAHKLAREVYLPSSKHPAPLPQMHGKGLL
ncbi:GTPase/DUF3482 domain-containing protein [Conchiformibius steedae DSM 2580]|uniref:GTPase/DUF3482 domain-containing protein n=1 Tax=Conchiformibius steedae DSM 2580 TaxID=1121352 RepID=A0AAE9HZD9_9NEIS|nr:GTPase/DUF3482 domain-containing protein [Conchiformibius steedae]QMT33322.1 GTPase/DUF3482 domain-containing protein [Conchiformibius steedae]URD67966.1 GTPase/DUF3482 domain-containing protein [Conchiformibius steedae DSM 2580]